MKKILILVLSVLCLCSCSREPSILDVENGSYDTVETLFAEMVTEYLHEAGISREIWECRMDKYFLYEHPDDLTYKGTLKGTILVFDYNQNDSVKVYKPVTIKFIDKKYERYAVQIGEVQ